MTEETNIKNNKIDEIMNRFLELEQNLDNLSIDVSENKCGIENHLDRIIDIQAQQLNRLNKNLELTNAILGEISGSLNRVEE